MQKIKLDQEWIRGAVSVEKKQDGIKPWRLPYEQIGLFHPQLADKAGTPAGVRVAFVSDSATVGLQWVPIEQEMQLDMVVEDTLTASATISSGEGSYLFKQHLPNGLKRIEFYLSQKVSVTLQELLVEEGATVTPLKNERPRWVTYGSSITQCGAAESPAQTWPALVARGKGWDLTCLGFGGQCHIEPMVARVIRDLPADVISLCLGINVQGNGSLNLRTFRSAVIGMVTIIREKHTETPLYLMSPIYSPPREDTANPAGMTLQIMREEIREALRILESYGDKHLTYIDGLDIFNSAHVAHLPDQLHPDAEGYKIMAENLLKKLR